LVIEDLGDNEMSFIRAFLKRLAGGEAFVHAVPVANLLLA
jgi:hypothetical protein